VNIEQCIIEGARITRQGAQVERGLFVIDDGVPLIYDGPRDVETLWNENYWATMAVRVTRARVMRTRPRFRSWLAETTCEVDPGLLDLDRLRAILNDAGSMTGLGDYRPRFGRFSASVDSL
jgi:hypothetical protein